MQQSSPKSSNVYLVILGDDHAGSSGEVKGYRGLVAPQVVDMEHNGLWQVLLATPDDPPQPRVHQPIPAGFNVVKG